MGNSDHGITYTYTASRVDWDLMDPPTPPTQADMSGGTVLLGLADRPTVGHRAPRWLMGRAVGLPLPSSQGTETHRISPIVFLARRLSYHSTMCLGVIKKKRRYLRSPRILQDKKKWPSASKQPRYLISQNVFIHEF